MSADAAKLSYNAALYRVKVDFTMAQAMASAAPPADLVTRARAKMEAIQNKGEISFFNLYEERLKKTWDAIRASKHPATKAFSITLAAGCPVLSGIQLQRSPDPKALALLTITASAKIVSEWRFEWFKLHISKELKKLGVRDFPNPSQLHGALIRAGAGTKIQALALSPIPLTPVSPEERKAKPYLLMASKARQEVSVVFHAPELIEQSSMLTMFSAITNATTALATPGTQFKLLRDHLTAAIKKAQEGPEAVGLDIPFVVLAAVGVKPAGVPMGKYPGAGRLRLSISAEAMEARIAAFDMKVYEDSSFDPNAEWLDREIKRHGIVFNNQPEEVKAVLDAIGRREDITGKVVAMGDPGMGGKQPYLHMTYKESNLSEAEIATKNVDLREMQQRTLVQRGQVVAEVRYGVEPKHGKTVTGQKVDPPKSEELSVTIGDGIQRKGNQFVAVFPGVPVVENDSISLNKALIHEGDVNLKTGNIRFEGPVEIHGSIDVGAVVDVTGDLKIAGGIRGGTVISGGELNVESGIVTGDTGKVTARGDIHCDFIENSTVIAGGSVTANKSIMSSSVISGGHIEVAGPTGVIAGGALACREYLKAQNVGLTRGAVTELNVGVDPRAEIAVQIRQRRLDRVNAKMTEDRQALRELTRKTGAQLTARHNEMKARLQNRLGKARLLIEKMQNHLALAKSMLNYNSEAKIYVNGLLSNNVKATVGGNVVAITHEVAGVAVCAKRRNGSHITSIEDAEAKDKKDAGGAKKAS